MAHRDPALPHPSQLDCRVNSFAAVTSGQRKAANLWFFDSPKNKARFTIRSDIVFMQCVLLEGLVDVVRYVPHPPAVSVTEECRSIDISADIYSYQSDGTANWLELVAGDRIHGGGSNCSRGKNAAATKQMRYINRARREIEAQGILFDNWLNLCAHINRCKNLIIHKELDFIVERSKFGSVTVRSLLSDSEDPAKMLSAIALSLHRGLTATDLDRRLWGYDSLLEWTGA